MGKVRKAVIPAAGRGRRMSPLSDYLPKPMLPLGKKPVLQHIIEEAKEAGIQEIALVIHPDHRAIRTYFREDSAIRIIIDASTSGPGGALLKAGEFIGGNPFLVIFSDAPVTGEGRGEHLQALMALMEQDVGAALSVYRIPPAEVNRRGIIELDDPVSRKRGRQITDMVEKPFASEYSGCQWASACRYIVGPAVMQALKKIERDEKGELQLTSAFGYLLSRGETVLGLPLDEELQRHDTGNFEGYFNALRSVL